ncbi:hypothetical protein PI126_g16883 [Phytophthora idaei]|nr:hypothetical protein PI126_g16883 [Phytophthora idaei]
MRELLDAALEGNLAAVQMCVGGAGATDKEEVLRLAAAGGHLGVVQYLAKECDVDVNAARNDGETAVMMAASNGMMEVIRYLAIQCNVVVNVRNRGGDTALMKAVYNGKVEVVRCLVEECGVDVNAKSYDGETALMKAISTGAIEVVHYLAKLESTDTNARNYDEDTALLIATKIGKLEVVRYLAEQCGADVNDANEKGFTALLVAAHNGDINVVRYLADECDADVNRKTKGGSTALSIAAASGKIEVVQYLAEKFDAKVRARDENGYIHAARNGHIDVLKYLVEPSSVDVNAKGRNGYTLLMAAAEYGQIEVVQYLVVQCRADINVRSYDGDTAFFKAVRSGRMKVVQYLAQECGADVNSKANNGNTVLMIAAANGKIEVVRYLVEKCGADINVRNNDGYTVFLEAVSRGRIEIVRYLAEDCDADVNSNTALLAAAANGIIDAVRYLIEQCGADVNAKTTDGNTVFFTAVKYGRIEVVRYCIKQLGADVNAMTTDGCTALIKATENDDAETVRCLVEQCGADVHVKSKKGDTAVRIATDRGFHEIQRILVPFVQPPLQADMRDFADNTVICPGLPFIRPFEIELTLFCPNGNIGGDFYAKWLDADASVKLFIPAASRSAFEVEVRLWQQLRHPNVIKIMEDLWLKVLSYLAKSDDTQYHREIEKFKRIRELLRDSSRGHALFGHFYTLLIEFRQIIKMSPEQAQFMRLSSTRATSNSLYALHWGLNALMTSLGGAVDTPTEREEQWQQQRKELIDVFVSGVADTLLVLHNLKSTEEKLAFMRTLRTEMESATGTYTTYQLEAMEKAHAEIAHHLATDGSDNLIAEWFIPWYELVVDKWSKLGEGGFGSVFRAKWLNSDVVVKQVHVAGSTDNTNSSVFDLSDSNLSESLNQSVPETQPDATARAEMLAMFRREVEIWFGFSHPHVIRLFGACHVGKPFFVCEYATNGTLVSYLRKNPDQLWTKLYEAALGVQYLHTRGVVHGDLKGNNIVVGSDFKAKVTDFGLSSIESSDVQPIVSAAWNWLAPECLSETKARPTSASDVYSLGMCIVEALRVVEAVRSGRGTQPCFPWANPDKASVIYNASRGNLPYRPTVCKDKQWDLIKRMCALDPTHRIKISTVVDELNTISKDNRIDTSPTDCSDMNFVPELISAARQLLVRLQDNTDRRDAVYVLSLYSFLLDSLEEVKEQVGTNPATKCRTEFFRLISDAKNATAAQLQDTNESLIKYAETTMRCYALDRRLDKIVWAGASGDNQFVQQLTYCGATIVTMLVWRYYFTNRPWCSSYAACLLLIVPQLIVSVLVSQDILRDRLFYRLMTLAVQQRVQGSRIMHTDIH